MKKAMKTDWQTPVANHYRRGKPVQPPPVYVPGGPDWRTQGPAAEVLQLPPREPPKPQHVLEINCRPARDLKRLVELVGQRRVERELNVHRTTVRRWLEGSVRIPGAQHLGIRYLLGDLPGTAGQWKGWRFHDGLLLSPAGDAFAPGQVLSLVLLRQQLTAQQAELAELKVRLAIAEEAERRHAGAANEDLRARA